MRIVYHLVPRATWEQSPPGPYADPSLVREGFLHCSNANQVEAVANLFFAYVEDLLVLHLDAGQLGDRLRDEPAAVVGGENPFAGQTFPHVYGALDRWDIVAVTPLRRDLEGRWCFSGRSE